MQGFGFVEGLVRGIRAKGGEGGGKNRWDSGRYEGKGHRFLVLEYGGGLFLSWIGKSMLLGC